MQAHDPWNQLGFSAEAELGPQWKSFRFTFTVDQDDPDARISWTGLHPGRYDPADVSLRPGGGHARRGASTASGRFQRPRAQEGLDEPHQHGTTGYWCRYWCQFFFR